MPGEVLECPQCHHQVRWGFPSRAIEFAQSKRHNATAVEIINEFFEFNPKILREKPDDCPQCKTKKPGWTILHVYD